MTEKTMWIVVLVQSGVATTAGIYSTEKKATFQAKKMRETISPNNDDVAIFQLFQDAAPVGGRIL